MDQTAEILVEIADKNYLHGDKTAYFSILTGTNGCKLESIPGSGQDYQTIIDAIHSYYRKHPSQEIIDGYQTGLKVMLRQITDATGLQDFLKILFYELDKEIEYRSSFSLPVGELLLQMKQTIQTYHLESIWNNYAGKVKEKYEIII